MTGDRQQRLAERLFAEHIYQVDFVRGSIGLLSVLPLLYGVLTWIWGEELWTDSAIYATALAVPRAPQSWGAVFIAIGLSLAFSALRRHYLLTEVVSMVAALVMGMFMVMFAVEVVRRDIESALPPALVYAVFSLLYLNLARLAGKMRHLEAAYDGQDE